MAEIHREFVVTLTTAAEAYAARRIGWPVITVPAVEGGHGEYSIVRCGSSRITAEILVKDVETKEGG